MPVEMLLKTSSGKLEKVLVYQIYQDLMLEGVACAVCWCPFSNSWYQCVLADLTPILPNTKTILNEII